MDKFIDVKTIFKNSKTVIKTGKINDDTYIMKIQDNKYIKNEIHIYKYIRKFDNNKNYVSCPKSISKISQTQYALIFPYDIHKIPLYKYILKHNYSYKTILDISLKCVNAILFIRQIGIIHRDIKPHNILYSDTDKKILIFDFDLSQKYDPHKLYKFCGTVNYMAPFLSDLKARSGQILKVADIWGIICVIYFLITKKPPFYDNKLNTTRDIVKRIRNKKYNKLKENTNDELYELNKYINMLIENAYTNKKKMLNLQNIKNKIQQLQRLQYQDFILYNKLSFLQYNINISKNKAIC
jgi:serine/threonine protein kinase